MRFEVLWTTVGWKKWYFDAGHASSPCTHVSLLARRPPIYNQGTSHPRLSLTLLKNLPPKSPQSSQIGRCLHMTDVEKSEILHIWHVCDVENVAINAKLKYHLRHLAM